MAYSMKVTFIRPNMYDDRSSDAMEPLCFAILKALTPDDVETKLYDERLEPIPVDEVVRTEKLRNLVNEFLAKAAEFGLTPEEVLSEMTLRVPEAGPRSES